MSSSCSRPSKGSVGAISFGRAGGVLEGVLAAPGTPEFGTVGCAASGVPKRVTHAQMAIGTVERLEDRMCHAPLDFEKRHNATRLGAWRYCSALRASA